MNRKKQNEYEKLELCSPAGHLQKAISAAQTFLLFNPKDKDMINNLDYYSEMDGVQEAWFVPRLEAVRYQEREEDEQALLDYIDNNFKFGEEDTKAADNGGAGVEVVLEDTIVHNEEEELVPKVRAIAYTAWRNGSRPFANENRLSLVAVLTPFHPTGPFLAPKLF